MSHWRRDRRALVFVAFGLAFLPFAAIDGAEAIENPEAVAPDSLADANPVPGTHSGPTRRPARPAAMAPT